MPRGVPNMPPGYMTPAQAARRAGMLLPNGQPNTPWVWARLDPTHPDMIPNEKFIGKGRSTYRIPIEAFDAWNEAHTVEKSKP